MTHDEAARPDASGEPGSSAPPPSDERPRPRYGEYAPPGWTWTPPGDENAAAGRPGAPVNADASAETSTHRQAAAGPGEAVAPTAPARDRFVTIALLVIGALGAWNSAASMQQIPQQMQLSYDMMGVGTFTAPDWLPTLAMVGTIAQLALYAVVLGLTIPRLRAGRLSFWIPLAGGVVSFIITMVLLGVVVLNDPAYLDWVSGMAAATPTPTP